MKPIIPLLLTALGAGILLGALWSMIQGTFEPTMVHLLGLALFAIGAVMLRRDQLQHQAKALPPPSSPPEPAGPRRGWHRRFADDDTPAEPRPPERPEPTARRGWTRRILESVAKPPAPEADAKNPAETWPPAPSVVAKGNLPVAMDTLPLGRVVTGAPLTLSLNLEGHAHGDIEAVLQQNGHEQRATAKVGPGTTMVTLPGPSAGPARIVIRLLVDGRVVGETVLEVQAHEPQDLARSILADVRQHLEARGTKLEGTPTPRQLIRALEEHTGTSLETARRVIEAATYDETTPEPAALTDALERVHTALQRLEVAR